MASSVLITLAHSGGGSTFAEDPALPVPGARIIWDAALDPGALTATAIAADGADPDAIDRARLEPWLTVAVDDAGIEHAVLSDGWQHLRLDVEAGSLLGGPVVLHYRVAGLGAAKAKLGPLRRLVDLVQRGRFARGPQAADPRIARHILVLRVHDALMAGASQHEIARALFGDHRRGDYGGDALRSRVRRHVPEARRLHAGAWRTLMHRPRR